VYGTIPREAAAARRMILNLADIFRYFLQSEKTFVPLSQEMQIVRAYLEVEQSRLAGRLTVDIQVDQSATQILIPALSIQPLVENAIRHGVALRTGPGYVRLQVEFRDDELRVIVENSRSGDAAHEPGSGIALENVRRRLEICYGQSAALHLAIGPEAAVAELSIPMARRPQPA
jgi:LytS/YehU family sensor histidine kinase